MSHTDPVILALLALGETAGTIQDQEHAGACAQCRAEAARLTEIVDLARSGGPAELLQVPPPQVWDRIALAVAADMEPSAVTAGTGYGDPRETSASNNPDAAISGGTRTAGGGSARQRVFRRDGRPGRLPVALAALVTGLVIGIGGTAGVLHLTQAPAARVIAQIELSPLPQFPQWKNASGTVVMRAAAGQQVLAVTLNAPRRPGFYEVWLLARNGTSMISLGDLSADHTGTFTIPPGTDLRDYSRIDVSLQPFNGSTVHVRTSVVRGSVPAVALGAAAGTATAR